MAIPTPLSAATTVDYIPAGVRRFTFVPTIASVTAPTSVELSAGTDYTPIITMVAGFTTTVADVSNETYGNTYQSVIPGMKSSSASSWQLKASSTSTDARTTLAEGTNGFVVIYNEGIATGLKCDVWPVRIKSTSLEQVAPGTLATIMVEFATTTNPSKNITIPTV